jgi:hypothetical protein
VDLTETDQDIRFAGTITDHTDERQAPLEVVGGGLEAAVCQVELPELPQDRRLPVPVVDRVEQP